MSDENKWHLTEDEKPKDGEHVVAVFETLFWEKAYVVYYSVNREIFLMDIDDIGEVRCENPKCWTRLPYFDYSENKEVNDD